MITIQFTNKEFRRLLDLVYIGNWILNSTRGDDRIEDYDQVESLVFSQCAQAKMRSLFEMEDGVVIPSRAFEDGGIQEAIMDYEDAVFYDILAEELARRDMDYKPIDTANSDELENRIDEYLDEFEANGVENLTVDK